MTSALSRAALPAATLGLAAIAVGVLGARHPAAGLSLALAAAFIAAAAAELSVAVGLFTVIVFLDVLPAPTADFSPAKLAGVMLLVAWVGTVTTRPAREREWARARPPALPLLLVAFVTWSALSATWAAADGTAVRATLRFGLGALLLMIAVAAVTSGRRAVIVAGAFVLGAALSALYGIAVPPAGKTAEQLSRAAGTIGDPNEFAAVLVAGSALAISLLVTAREPVSRALLVGAAIAAGGGVVLSLSRGGLVALACALVAGVLLGGRWRPLMLLIAVGVAAIGIAYFGAFAPAAARERVRVSSGTAGRTDLWRIAWRMVGDKPLTGVGAGNFRTAAPRFLLVPGRVRRSDLIVDKPQVVHNSYLEVLAELGFVGLALFGAIVGLCVTGALRAAREFRKAGSAGLEALSRGVLIALLGLLTAGVFISAEYEKELWLLLGLAAALERLSRSASRAVLL